MLFKTYFSVEKVTEMKTLTRFNRYLMVRMIGKELTLITWFLINVTNLKRRIKIRLCRQSMWTSFWSRRIFGWNQRFFTPSIGFCSQKSKPNSLVAIWELLRTWNRSWQIKWNQCQLKTSRSVSRSWNNVFVGVRFLRTILKERKLICY